MSVIEQFRKTKRERERERERETERQTDREREIIIAAFAGLKYDAKH